MTARSRIVAGSTERDPDGISPHHDREEPDSSASGEESSRRPASFSDDEGLIDNPFKHLTPKIARRQAREFASENGLGSHSEVFEKAATVLLNSPAWKHIKTLTEDEREVLQTEEDSRSHAAEETLWSLIRDAFRYHSTGNLRAAANSGFWGQPKDLRETIITLCIAAVVQGWNQTATNGANLTWWQDLGQREFPDNLNTCSPRNGQAWIFALINAATYLAASLVGCWISDWLNEVFYGRRNAIGISALLILAASIGCALCKTWPQLLICRLLLGVGMGAKASVVPVMAAEVSPSHMRGSLVMNWQLFDACGIFLGFTANLIAYRVTKTAWRWQMASSAIPAIILVARIYSCPESPRFLMKHDKDYRNAYRTLILFRGHPLLAAKELLYVHYQMNVEMSRFSQVDQPRVVHSRPANGGSAPGAAARAVANEGLHPKRISGSLSYFQKLIQLFRVRRIRQALISAVVCMVSQQLCGVNVLAFYSSTIYCVAGGQPPGAGTDLMPLFLSWGIGLTNFLFAFPAYWLIDRKGRRWLLLTTIPFLALTLLAAALSFLPTYPEHMRAPVIGLFTYLFLAFYSWGLGPVPFTLSAEVFPLEHRMVGMSFAVFTNLFGAGLLTLFVPILTEKISHPGMIGLFAGLNVVAWFLVLFFVRETAGATLPSTYEQPKRRRSRAPQDAGPSGTDYHVYPAMTFMLLEELNYIFNVPASTYMRYQRNCVLPWFWQHYITRKNDEREPLTLRTWMLSDPVEMRRRSRQQVVPEVEMS